MGVLLSRSSQGSGLLAAGDSRGHSRGRARAVCHRTARRGRAKLRPIGFGFGVFGFRVSSLGIRVYGSEFWSFKVQGLEFRILVLGLIL